jgi:hypothetical protein
MRSSISIAIAFALVLVLAARSRAFELTSELTVGPNFLYRTTDVEGELCDGRLGLGGGYTMVSDFHDVRFGGQALIAVHGSWISGTLAGSWGPSQAGRGWATVAPQGELHFELGRVVLDGALEVTLRRADAALRHKIVAVDQLQLRAQIAVTLDERWHLEVAALRSFYDPDLALPSLRRADAGLSVTLAGRPERWAVDLRGGRSFNKKLGAELGLAWVMYADDRGHALVPRLALRGGPWRGVSVELSGDVAIGVERAVHDPPRAMGGLKLAYER